MPTTNGATNPKNLLTATDARHISLLYHPNMQKESLPVEQRLHIIAQDLGISKAARTRLSYIIFYL